MNRFSAILGNLLKEKIECQFSLSLARVVLSLFNRYTIPSLVCVKSGLISLLWVIVIRRFMRFSINIAELFHRFIEMVNRCLTNQNKLGSFFHQSRAILDLLFRIFLRFL